MEIAVLLTCHNRRQKTVLCIQSLKDALDKYNNNVENRIYIEIFLTDDGCTDGTIDAVKQVIEGVVPLHVLHGDGNLYWAGGMRFCWKEAMKRQTEWDYFLLLNDDVVLMDNVFNELLSAELFTKNNYKTEGLISGITCAKKDPNMLTYGGSVWKNRFLATKERLVPDGRPQLCDQTNANILLVPNAIVRAIGIFSDKFTHGAADYDYSFRTQKAGFKVVLTAHFCGKCDNDHGSSEDIIKKELSMTLRERMEYFKNPVHSSQDYLRFIWCVSPIRYPMVWIGRMLNIYYPRFYYYIDKIRY